MGLSKSQRDDVKKIIRKEIENKTEVTENVANIRVDITDKKQKKTEPVYVLAICLFIRKVPILKYGEFANELKSIILSVYQSAQNCGFGNWLYEVS